MMKNWLVINLNKKYFLKVGNQVFACQIGEGGLKKAVKKTEGDKTTPVGNWYFKTIYYRSDKVFKPKFKKKNVLKVNKINFDEPDKGKNKIAFDNLTPLYPNERIKLEVETNKVEKKLFFIRFK